MESVELAGEGLPFIGVAAGDGLVAGDGGVHIITGGDDRAEVVSHDDGVQLVYGCAIQVGIFEGAVIVMGGLACGKRNRGECDED